MEKNINEQIQKQIDAGFTSKEILQNLTNDGFSKEEISSKINLIKKANGVAATSGSSVSTGRVFWVVFIVILIIVRIYLRSTRR